MITMEELRSLREKTTTGKEKNAAIIPAGELERIKQTIIVTDRKEELKRQQMEKTLM